MTPFNPKYRGTVNVEATTSSDLVGLLTDAQYPEVVVYNKGTVEAFIEFGDSEVTAVVDGSKPIAPGAMECLTPLGTYMAVITESGTAKVYASAGKGI